MAPDVDPANYIPATVRVDGVGLRDGAGVGVWNPTNPNSSYPGFQYGSRVKTPDAFLPAGYTDPGGWCWVQIATESSSRVTNGGTSEKAYFGPDATTGAYFQTGLDSIFPYCPPVNPMPVQQAPTYNVPTPSNFSFSPARGTLELFRADDKDSSGNPSTKVGFAEDHPSIVLHSDAKSYNAGDAFNTYQMYRPPGTDSQFVPVQKILWVWSANVTWSGTQWTLGSKFVGQRLTTQINTVEFPDWDFLCYAGIEYFRFSSSPPTGN